MSRVVYENTPATVAQEALRQENRVRLVDPAEEGSGVNVLPGGVYGYTYSPGLHNAPLFRSRRYRSFETHKLASGEVILTGFVSSDDARQFTSATSEVTVLLKPEPDEAASTLIAVPYSRIQHHRQHAAPNQNGVTLTLAPA